MIRKLTLAAGLIALGILATPHATSVAAMPQTRLPAAEVADTSLVQQAKHYRHYYRYRYARLHRHRFVYLGAGGGYCSAWRYNCAARWGWRSHRYFRCVWAHGC
jgi:hypothetical protein